MLSPSAQVRRHFLPWDRPLLPQAVAFLAGDWRGGAVLDLSAMLVLVPTRQSGRRLREALAGFAAEKGQAVFPPQVLSLDALIATDDTANVASRLESLLAWAQVFREIDLETFRAVFPIDPPDRNFSWSMRLAKEFSRLQNTLAEVGLTLADVPLKVESTFPELERWQQIAELGNLQEEKLASVGLRDAQAVKIEVARKASVPEGIVRIVILATADPRPIALTVLARHALTVPVDVVIFAAEHESAAFDEWGRPRAEVWAKRTLMLADFEQHVQLLSDPGVQAECVSEAALIYKDVEGLLGVGVVDPEILSLVETGLRQTGLGSFNPEGRGRLGDGLYQLLSALAGLVRDEAFATVAALARCPDFLVYLETRIGGGFSVTLFLKTLDRIHADHLPPDLAEARRHWPASRELAVIAELREQLTSGVFPDNAASVLAEIFSARRFDLGREADVVLKESAEAWSDVMGEVARAASRFDAVRATDWWEVALRLYGESMRFEDKSAGDVELQGWLELIWEDAPHLIVAGLNDGRVPDAVVGDPFLPEALRVRLGLKTNAMRFACDAYFLQALAASRATGGRIDILLGKTSVAGDPLRPSRLLLRCEDEDLPRRIEFLFKGVESAGTNLPWRRAWRLHPRNAPLPERIAVTALRAWLNCPFRFYLSRVLRMEAVDAAKTELDVMDFGTLCHAALEAMGHEPALRDGANAEVLREFLLSALEKEARKRFGSELTLPLIVQMESARQRLSRAAEVQAMTRSEGWVIERVEWKFAVPVAGLTVSGKIDRIDRHEQTGAIRVLDYKTSDKPVNPVQAHLRNLKREEVKPAWTMIESSGEVWTDLQLPLYERAAAAEFPGAEITCGYFNLPKASMETDIALWDGYSREVAESAWRCAEGVVQAMLAREFWPPQELSGQKAALDDFAALFHQGAAESIDFAAAGIVPAEEVS